MQSQDLPFFFLLKKFAICMSKQYDMICHSTTLGASKMACSPVITEMSTGPVGFDRFRGFSRTVVDWLRSLLSTLFIEKCEKNAPFRCRCTSRSVGRGKPSCSRAATHTAEAEAEEKEHFLLRRHRHLAVKCVSPPRLDVAFAPLHSPAFMIV